MDSRWAVIIGAAVVGGIVWWYGGHPGYETAQQRQARIEAIDRKDAGPTLYRWKDERGVTQITDTPPAGRKYTVVSIRDDQNVVSLPQAETPEQKRARERKAKGR
jgi:hypothetical protein